MFPKISCRFNFCLNVQLLRRMSSESSVFMPPLEVKGMKEFDADKFTKQIEVPYVKVPSKLIGRIVGSKTLQEFSLRRNQTLKPILNGEDKDEKLMLFDPELIAKKEDAASLIHDSIKQLIDTDISLQYKQFTLTYKDWDVKRCLKAVLPDDLDFSGHTQAGHILHLNLREELMPYKFVISKILLDKINYARTVVNKLDQINSEFRFFDLELLAGEPDYIATVSENGFKFKLDFSKVFWNSRLNNEHSRIINEIKAQKQQSVVFDVFAGVGPFVVPAVFVPIVIKAYANDLNPTSIEYMNENLKINKASDKKYSVYNLDGAEFIRTVLPIAYKEHCLTESNESINFHVLMNLPALAVSFLPAFKASLSEFSNQQNDKCQFIVHCYMFVKAFEDHPESWFEEQAIKMVKDQIESNGVEIIKVTYVRNVANRKNMYCVSFKLPFDFLFIEKSSGQSDCEYSVAEKKRKLESLMSRLLGCTLNSGPRLFCVVVTRRNFMDRMWKRLEKVQIPWDYLQVRRKLSEAFPSRFQFERVAALGPDFACLEWLMNCGATCVDMSDGTSIKSQKQMREFIASHGFNVKDRKLKPLADVKPLNRTELTTILLNEKAYRERWPNVPPVYIKYVDASDSIVADPGFQYFRECYQLEKLVLGFCDFFGDPAIDNLASGRAQITLKELEILFNPSMSDVAFYSIIKLTALKRAHFYFNPYVINEKAAKKRLKEACPRAQITYPPVKYIGTGKNV